MYVIHQQISYLNANIYTTCRLVYIFVCDNITLFILYNLNQSVWKDYIGTMFYF